MLGLDRAIVGNNGKLVSATVLAAVSLGISSHEDEHCFFRIGFCTGKQLATS